MADKTSLQEASQALFCALADYLGQRETTKSFDKAVYKTYDEFMKNYDPPGQKNITQLVKEAYSNNVDTPGVTLSDIETFLSSDKSWFHSSMNIAEKVLSELDNINRKFTRIQRVNWSDVVYVRGDSDVMGSIQKLFTSANSTLKEVEGPQKAFGNINKWSPADIYFASAKAKTKLSAAAMRTQNKNTTFEELNSMISSMIDSGDLLPLSLKKQTGEVSVVKMNFDEESGELPYFYAGIGGKEADARSLVVLISETNSEDLVIRHDASTSTFSGGTYKLEIRMKGGARGGSLSGKKIIDAAKDVDSTFGLKLEQSMNTASTNFANEARKKLQGLKKDPPKSIEGIRYREIRNDLSKKHFTDSGPNKTIRDYLEKNVRNGKSTALVKAFITAAASKGTYSAKYIIAK
jgi:hypothetical protein